MGVLTVGLQTVLQYLVWKHRNMNAHKFIGDREAPTPIEKVRAGRPILGTGKMPEALIRMAQARTLYSEVNPDNGSGVKVTALQNEGQQLWKIDVPVGDLNGCRPGLSAQRHPASKILAEIPAEPSYQSYRPDWIDAMPSPRVKMERDRPYLRRTNGNYLEPLWVYDNARHVIQDASWPFGCVGRLTNDEGAQGSATLVGERLVLTAGHAVPWNSVAAGKWWMKFVPAYFNGASLFGAGVESFVSDVIGYDTAGGGNDWAILRLWEPLGASLGFMGFNSYSDSWNDLPVWNNIGYPGDIANSQQPAFQQGFTINDTDGADNDGEELETENCDLNHGNSGGPMFAWFKNGTDPRVVGVVSGQEVEYKFPASSRHDNVFAGGDGMCSLVAFGRAIWLF
jgi:V8-like Glu-specific endopeptidase